MTIAIDYDGTISEDIGMFLEIIKTIKKYGHNAIIVTMRDFSEADLQIFDIHKSTGIEVLFTSRKAKKPFLEKLNIKPDIWIDDNPKWIYEDAL